MSYTLTTDLVNTKTIVKITLNGTFNNGDTITIDPEIYDTIGMGTPIGIEGDNLGYDFKINIIAPTTETNFTLGTSCFENKNIIQFTYPSQLTFKLSNYSFKGSKLTSITLPKLGTNVDDFGVSVFENCVNLVDFNFGDNGSLTLENIPVGMLSGCTKLNNIDIPTYVKTFGENSFADTIIKTFTFTPTSSVNTIGQRAFYQSTIPELTLPSSVLTISTEAFMSSKIPSITLNTGLETISDSAFKNSIISDLELPLSLTSIEQNAFTGIKVIDLILPIFTNYCQIGISAFSSCMNLQTVKIDGKIMVDVSNQDQITEQMFSGCQNLRSVEFYSGLTQINTSAFSGCINLNELTFYGTTATTIKTEAFNNCGFDYLHLPSNIITFEEFSFKNCSKLQQVILEATSPILTGNVFSGSTLMTELILCKGFGGFTDDSFTKPNNSFRFYVFTPEQRDNILTYVKYKDLVVYNPYHHRNFINVKAIYHDEHDPAYVMYTLPSSSNTFNDCTFYFEEGNQSNPIVVIPSSLDGVMTNCVKMYSTTTNEGDKVIVKVYNELGQWNILLNNGTLKLPQDIDNSYNLANNFTCSTEYTGSIFTVNGQYINQCDMSDLSNLTKSGNVSIENINKIKLTSLNNNNLDEFDIKILSSTGQQMFEVNDIDANTLTFSGREGYISNITLIIENTVRPRKYPWSIVAPKIIINQLTVNYTIFQQQKQDAGEAILTQISCEQENAKNVLKFVADKIINFYTIQNKDNNMFHSQSTEINAEYYISGWTM